MTKFDKLNPVVQMILSKNYQKLSSINGKFTFIWNNII